MCTGSVSAGLFVMIVCGWPGHPAVCRPDPVHPIMHGVADPPAVVHTIMARPQRLAFARRPRAV